MASTFVLTVCLGMLATCLAAPITKIRWCAKSEAEVKKCKDWIQTCTTDKISLTCVHKASTDDCFKAIAEGLADAMALDSGDVYRASLKPYNLKPIMAENYGTEKDVATCYYAVALVKKSSTFMFDDLKGKKSCHTAVGRMAGWIIPIGTLQKKGLLPASGPDDHNKQKAVSKYFSASCAPGAKEEKLCRLCAGQGKEKKCKLSGSEPYYGYDGACRCLKDGKGNVAFVKAPIPDEYNKEYELLCPDNTRKPISEHAECNLGKVPSHTVVSVFNTDMSNAIIEFLQEAQKKPECKLFSSPHGKDLLVKDSAKGLIPLPSNMDASLYLGKELIDDIKILQNANAKPPQDRIRWCTQSKEEKSKCDTWAIASEGAIECVEASLAEECIAKILKGDADAVTLDGGYMYTAGVCGLVPAMGEIYDADECRKTGTTPGTYYAVAVVKASDTDISWNNLEGKLSCHTAVGRTAGWVIPIGLIRKKTGICDMSTFFKASCAPGADVNSNLCKLCAGDPQKSLDGTKCSANNQELYYGYEGALRCLVEQGQVAFVKHTTVFEVVKANPEWLGKRNLDDFSLLCGDGSVKPVSDYKTCHLAEVPAHGAVTSPPRKEQVVRILKDQQSKFGRKNDKSAQMFYMFNSEGRKDQLFKDSTQCLREITGTMNDFLGPEYVDAVSSNNNCTQSELLKVCTFHSCKI